MRSGILGLRLVCLVLGIIFSRTSHAVVCLGPVKMLHSHLGSEAVIKIIGPADFCDVQGGAFNVTGPVVVDGIRAQTLKVLGTIKGQRIEVDALSIIGPLEVDALKACHVSVTGPCYLTNSQLKFLEAISNQITLQDTQVDDVYLKGDKGTKQLLILKGQTCIHGDVTFESKEGVVHVYDTACVQGSIKGGKIRKF